MKLTDYKFWYVKRDDDVHISECAIRLFEGEVTTVNELDINGKPKPVTRYRRSKRLKPKEMDSKNDKKMRKDRLKRDCIVYTAEDFGVITTKDELRDFLDEELAKDTTRKPIPEQDKDILNKTKR